MDKINIYINSKNRDLSEKISNFTVRIPQNLLRLSQGEYFTLNVNGFYCYNSWFNCIDGFNNEFQIIIKNIDDEIIETYYYKLNDGNPNVNDVKSNLNGLLINKVLVSYDKQRNKFVFKRSLPVSTQNYTMYLNIINSEDFLGFYKSDTILYAVVEQPFVKATEKTNLDLVKQFMLSNGFENTRNNDYINKNYGIILEDLHDENVLTQNGVLHFIDTVFYISSSF
jgi:hypothetical protein